MQKLLQWLIVSSANPSKLSATVKGLLLGVLPVVVYLTGLAHLNVGESDLKALIDGIATVVEVGLGLVSAVVFVIGLVRKIYRTLTGTNQAI